MLRQIDLCSGVGAGFALAGFRAGFNLEGFAETDPFCAEVLKLRYPGVKNYGNLKINKTWPQVDLITASPPCQPFSCQGNRRGKEDPRDCVPYVRSIIEQINPAYWAIENVPGLLSIHGGDYFREILAWATERGYDCEWITVSSGHVGAPYLRKRLLLLGVSRSLGGRDIRSKPAWAEQIRRSIKRDWVDRRRGSFQPGISRSELGAATWLDKSTGNRYSYGVAGKDGTNRRRRQALGNLFDPRVAQFAIDRILYHEMGRPRADRGNLLYPNQTQHGR